MENDQCLPGEGACVSKGAAGVFGAMELLCILAVVLVHVRTHGTVHKNTSDSLYDHFKVK